MNYKGKGDKGKEIDKNAGTVVTSDTSVKTVR